MKNDKNGGRKLKVSNKKTSFLESDIADANEQLNSIFNAAPLGMGYVVNRKFVRVNEAFCDMLGYNPEELVGQDARMAYPSDEEYNSVGEEKYSQISKYGKGSVETRFKRKNGDLIDVLLSSVPVDPGDISKGTTFTAMDISQQKESENKLQYRLEFERLIAEISIRFINLEPGDIHETFFDALQKIGNFTQSDRVYIMLFTQDQAMITLSALWTSPNDPFQDPSMGSFPTEKIQWWVNQLSDDKLFQLTSLDEIPDNETTFKNYAQRTKIKSQLDIPIFKQDKLIGCLGFNTTTLERSFTEDEIAMLRIFSEIISNVLQRKQMETALQESKVVSKNIIEKSPLGIHIYKMDQDDRLILTGSNDAADNITGIETENLIGLPIEEAFPGSGGTELPEKYKKAAVEGEIYTKTDLVYKDDQIEGAYNIIAFQLAPDEMAVMFQDITEMKHIQQALEESELHYRSLYMEAPNGYQSLNQEGYILEVNPIWCEITGYKNTEVIGIPFSDLLIESDRKKFELGFQKLIKSGSTTNNEYDLIRNNKEIVHISLNGRVNLDIDGNFKQTHCIITDFSERKKLEEEMQIAKERAEESDRLKSAFLANMSHEIRTPMNAILGFSELLVNSELTQREREDYIKMIHAKGNELMIIISDLIDISRIEAGDLKLTETNFAVNDFLSTVHVHFKEDKLLKSKPKIQFRKRLQDGLNPIIYSDKNRLKQVFNNLLSNAMKFTSDGFIELGYDIIENQIRFYVKDSGIGIDSDKFEVIFERFRQADYSYTRKYGGTGLGLAISKQIVELLGGKIGVESKPNVGSTFYFTLDFKSLHAAPKEKLKSTEEASPGSLDFSNKKILVAEDDGSNYLYLESVLRNTNAELIWARNGKHALDLFTTIDNIDLILMDIRMPEMNGLEATEQIRIHNKEVPIIALTAFAFADDKSKSIRAGCNEHLSKPVKTNELKDMLKKYLS